MWLLLAVPAVITLYLGYTLFEVGRSTTRDDRDRADAIIVLGAAQYDGRPSPVFERRLDHALELYEEGVASVNRSPGCLPPVSSRATGSPRPSPGSPTCATRACPTRTC